MSGEISANDRDEDRRMFAERIISGEYSSAVCLMELEDGTFECWREGSLLSALGLLECAKIDFTRRVHKGPEDEG